VLGNRQRRAVRTLGDKSRLEVEEVRRIVGAADSLHNRAFFWAAYSCGLRLQEAVNLQVKDVDGDRMMLHVHRDCPGT